MVRGKNNYEESAKQNTNNFKLKNLLKEIFSIYSLSPELLWSFVIKAILSLVINKYIL